MVQRYQMGRPDLWPPLRYRPNAARFGSTPYTQQADEGARRRAETIAMLGNPRLPRVAREALIQSLERQMRAAANVARPVPGPAPGQATFSAAEEEVERHLTRLAEFFVGGSSGRSATGRADKGFAFIKRMSLMSGPELAKEYRALKAADFGGAISDSEVRRGLIRARMVEMAQSENSNQDETYANQELLLDEEEDGMAQTIFEAVQGFFDYLAKQLGKSEKDLTEKDPPVGAIRGATK